jgi:putative oxidoreductase
MAEDSAENSGKAKPGRGFLVGLWVVQLLLGSTFISVGVSKLILPVERLKEMGAEYAEVLPSALLLFIGLAELLGGIGVILPALLRIKPWLTPLAALGLLVIMILAFGYHVKHSEWHALPINTILGAMAAFIVWGRLFKARIKPRA